MKTACIAISLAFSASAAAADQDWCRDLFDQLPGDVFEQPEVERVIHDEPERGFAVRYQYGLPEALTLYLFDGGHAEITEEIAEQQFFQGAQELLVTNKSRAYQPLGQPEFRRIDTGATSAPMFRMRLLSETGDIPLLNDYLVVFGWGNCIAKVRLTTTEAELAQAEAAIEGVVDRLRAALLAAE